MIEKTDYRVVSHCGNYQLLLRNKRLAGNGAPQADKTVLFVHGATYGSTDTVDYAPQDQSWLDVLALQGFDAWCIDLLGYGQSDRPAEMNQPAESHAPLVDTAFAVADVHQAVTFIRGLRHIEGLNLIGYSWGTAICGSYTGQYPHSVIKLVLHGALWIEGLAPTGDPVSRLGAYRTVDPASMMTRWSIGLDSSDIDRVVSEQERLRWCEQTAGCDPRYLSTGLLRAPTGVMKDYLQFRESGLDWYDPSLVCVPVQIVVGAWDAETTPAQGQRLFERLTHATTKQMTLIGEGTHSLMLERNRLQLHSVVNQFLLS
ncbi:MAG: alpha/beta fold hydrolase [Pseudomonadota bacterium]|nr:alpha/beta fold hydrolase [Pseudomonadota bacterium]